MFGLRLKLVKAAFLVTSVQFCEDGFIIGLTSCHNVKEDPGEFMSDVLDGFDGAVARTLRTIIIAQIGLVVMKTMGSQTEALGGAVLGSDFRPADATASAGTIFRT